MLQQKQNQVEWLEFELFQPYRHRLLHGCFTRKGGVSNPPYDSLNVGLSVGDDRHDVLENRARIAQALGIDTSHLFDVEQIHTTDVVMVRDEPTSHRQADILLTETPNRLLMIKHADCQAGLFYDPVHHVCAAVHAGWKGLVQKAYTKAIHTMTQLWNTSPEDLLVGISPSLMLCHSEFRSWKEETPQEMWRFIKEEKHVDLMEMAKEELLRAAIAPHHIECARLCTFDCDELFFSYRRSKVTGRTATCITLLPLETDP